MKMKIFHTGLAQLFAVFIKVMAKNFTALRTCSRGSVVMATIYVVVFGLTVYEYPHVENRCKCANIQSYVNI